jgi:outer membrane protein assembly factor BamB
LLVKYVNNQLIWAQQLPEIQYGNISFNKQHNNLILSGISIDPQVHYVDQFVYEMGPNIFSFDADDGKCKWVKSLPNYTYDYGSSTNASAETGSLFWTINGNSSHSNKLLSLNPATGDIIWSKYINYDISNMAPAPDGTCYLTGKSLGGGEGDGTQSNYFISRWDENGNELWFKRSQYGGAGFAITLTNEGDILGAGLYSEGGYYSGQMGMGVEKYDADGNEIWHYQMTGTTDCYPKAEKIIYKNGIVYVSGTIRQEFSKGMLLKIAEPGVSAVKENIASIEFNVFPNPTRNRFVVTYKSNNKNNSGISLIVRTVTGQQVFSKTYPTFNGSLEENIQLSQPSKGTYLVELRQGEMVESRKIVIE